MTRTSRVIVATLLLLWTVRAGEAQRVTVRSQVHMQHHMGSSVILRSPLVIVPVPVPGPPYFSAPLPPLFAPDTSTHLGPMPLPAAIAPHVPLPEITPLAPIIRPEPFITVTNPSQVAQPVRVSRMLPSEPPAPTADPQHGTEFKRQMNDLRRDLDRLDQQRNAAAQPAAPQSASASAPSTLSPRSAEEIVKLANLHGRCEPTGTTTEGGLTRFPYDEKCLYQVYLLPGRLTKVRFGEREVVLHVGAGDTKRWIPWPTSEDKDNPKLNYIEIKPTEEGLETNVIITTNLRTYLLELSSTKKGIYMPLVTWVYPEEERQRHAEQERLHRALQIPPVGKPIHRSYIWENRGKTTPQWIPTDVFDDGEKVYIRFPTEFKTTDAPVLYVVSPKNELQLVNYRVRGEYYVADLLFQTAELRVGEGKEAVVRIERELVR